MRAPRRLLFAVLSVPFLFLLFLYFRPALYPTASASTGSLLPEEIFGLLHFVTSPDEAGRRIVVAGTNIPENLTIYGDSDGALADSAIVPEYPVDLAWYALGSIAKTATQHRPPRRKSPVISAANGQWEERLRVLREEYPLVVFSKTYCPYSKRLKRLLEAYDLSPAPKIVEVDLRADSSHIKTLLTRLTQRSTFPNVILHGRSLGGSDDLVQLHREDRLREVLEEGGVKVNFRPGDGSQDVLLR